MDMNNTGNVPSGVNTHYDRNMLYKARPSLVHTLFSEVRDVPKNDTDKIRFRRYSLLTADTTAIVEGVTPSLDELQITNIDATVQQYGRGFLITDKLMFTTLDPVLMEVSDILGENAGNTFDVLAREELHATTNIQYASTATSNATVTSAMKITKEEVMQAVRTLKNSNTKKITKMIDASTGFNTSPVDAAYIGIVHPNAVFDLKQLAGFIRVEEYGQRKAFENEVGSLDEVRFLETTNGKVFAGAGDSGIDVYATLIFGDHFSAISRISGEALKNIIKGPGSAGTADPFDQRQTSVWKGTFVATVLNDAFGVSLRHAVSA